MPRWVIFADLYTCLQVTVISTKTLLKKKIIEVFEVEIIQTLNKDTIFFLITVKSISLYFTNQELSDTNF